MLEHLPILTPANWNYDLILVFKQYKYKSLLLPRHPFLVPPAFAPPRNVLDLRLKHKNNQYTVKRI